MRRRGRYIALLCAYGLAFLSNRSQCNGRRFWLRHENLAPALRVWDMCRIESTHQSEKRASYFTEACGVILKERV